MWRTGTPRCDKEGLGGTMAELKIIQSNMMAYMAKEAIRDVYPEERPYIISRAGYAGIQRYAQVWAGDNLTDWKTTEIQCGNDPWNGDERCSQ